MEALVAANRICDGPTTTNLGNDENQRLIQYCKDTMINRRLDVLESKHADDRCAAMA